MDLITAVKVTYEVMGLKISDLGIQAMVADLRAYPEPDVLEALSRCRKELRKLTLTDILDRLTNGHPGVEESWAISAPGVDNEDVSIVWTDEMASACGVARTLKDDPVAARMAFKEAYIAAVGKARAANRKPQWRVSLGFDPLGRQLAIQDALEKGRVSVEYARTLLPEAGLPAPGILPAIEGF